MVAIVVFLLPRFLGEVVWQNMGSSGDISHREHGEVHREAQRNFEKGLVFSSGIFSVPLCEVLCVLCGY